MRYFCNNNINTYHVARKSVRTQPVPNAWLGDEVAWACGIDLELLTQLAHVHSQILDFPRVRGPPHHRENLLVGEDSAGVTHHHAEELVLRRCEPYFGTSGVCRTLREIDSQFADVQNGRHRVGAGSLD